MTAGEVRNGRKYKGKTCCLGSELSPEISTVTKKKPEDTELEGEFGRVKKYREKLKTKV